MSPVHRPDTLGGTRPVSFTSQSRGPQQGQSLGSSTYAGPNGASSAGSRNQGQQSHFYERSAEEAILRARDAAIVDADTKLLYNPDRLRNEDIPLGEQLENIHLA